MVPAWWSFLLTAIGVFGLYIASRKLWWGWAVNLGAQGLWIAYALATGQYGFVFSAFAYGAVYARGARAWWREQHTQTPVAAGSSRCPT